MNCYITEDNKFLVLDISETTNVFRGALKKYFTREYKNAFMIRQYNPYAITEEEFIAIQSNEAFLPVGLWVELVNFCNENDIELYFQFDINEKIKTRFDENEFLKFIDEWFDGAMLPNGKKFYPYKHQLEAVASLLKYKKASISVATGGGKTLIMYILFVYIKFHLKDTGFVIFTPSTDLTKQACNEFQEYHSFCSATNEKPDFTYSTFYTGSKNTKIDVDIKFGNYQSLTKRGSKFYKDVHYVFGDEIHHISAKSVRTIIQKAQDAKCTFGVTGTFPKEGTFDNYIAQSFIGPVVYVLSSYDMININKTACPVYVIQTELQYHDLESMDHLWKLRFNKTPYDIDEGKALKEMEQTYIRNYQPRLDTIVSLVNKFDKNTLIMFTDIKNGYGKRLAKELKTKTTKRVYYVDGDTPSKDRDFYKQEMEDDEEENTIIVASIGTFGEGISIKRLWYIFLVETTKSDRIIAQMLGRGMREFPGKDCVLFFDIRDNLNYGEGTYTQKTCYMMKDAAERDKSYKERRFPIHKKVIDIQHY